MKRFIGNRKETLSSICAVDDKADLIVKKPPVSKDKRGSKSAVAAAASKENRRIATATRKLARGGQEHSSGPKEVGILSVLVSFRPCNCVLSAFRSTLAKILLEVVRPPLVQAVPAVLQSAPLLECHRLPLVA